MNNRSCDFCNIKKKHIVFEDKLTFLKFDINPVTLGHMLIIPRRHFKSFFDIKKTELVSILSVLNYSKKIIKRKYPEVKSFNLAINYGIAAGQKINHCHFHLVPRRTGDYDLRLNKIQTETNGKFFWVSR